MSSGKIIKFLIILQALIVQNKEIQRTHPFLSKLVNSVLFKNDLRYTTPEYYDQCKRNCMSKSVSLYRRNGSTRYMRFTDRSTNNSSEEHEMEAPAAKESLLELLTGEEEGGGGDEEEEKDDGKLQVLNEEMAEYEEEQDQKLGVKENKLKEKTHKKEEDEDDDDDDYEFDFFNDDDNDSGKKKVDDVSASKDKNEGEGKWPNRGLSRRKRIQNLIFPLLLAYKLKLVAAIPFFVGIVILLMGTTSMAGFFFALFSAALGLHNTHFHH